MKYPIFVAAMILSASAQAAPTLPPAPAGQASPPSASAAPYELKIGDTVYQVIPDQPFTVQMPGGETVPITLHRKAQLQFSGHGVTFSYPSDMTVSTEHDPGVTSIAVNSINSTTATIQVYPDIVTVADVRQALLTGIRSQLKSSGGRLKATSATAGRSFGGTKRPGQVVEWVLGGVTFHTEMSVFPKDESIIAVLLQWTDDDRKFADTHFPIITQSFK